MAQFTAPDEKDVTTAVNFRQAVSSLNTAAGNIADDSEALKHNLLLRASSSSAATTGNDRRTFRRTGIEKSVSSLRARTDGFGCLLASYSQRDSNGAESLTAAARLLLKEVLSKYGAKVLQENRYRHRRIFG